MIHRSEFMQRARARGAIAVKLAVAAALGASVLWSARYSSLVPTVQNPGRATAPAEQDQLAQIPGPGAVPQPPSPGDQKADPFAGVDVGSDPVLRHIVGIEEPGRVSRAEDTQRRPVPARIATAPTEPTAAGRVRTPPPGQAAPVATVADASAPPLVDQARDPALVAAPPVARVLPDTAAKQSANEKGPATAATVGAPAVDADRVLALARVDTPPAAPPVVAPPRAIRRTVPVFPGEAIKAGIKTGRVLARVSIDADGRVSESQIVSATPPGYFERESQRALAAWRYEAPGRSTSTDVELVFSRD